MNIEKYRVPYDGSFKISKTEPGDSGKFESKEEATEKLKENVKKMAELQDKMYAHDKYGLLLIFQAMDAAGKDGAIKHVMSGLNPQGTQVFSFKNPSPEELDHDYLWRINKSLPERGRIGIFNRSHYEEVLVVKVHDLQGKQKLPPEMVTNKIWDHRYRQIKDFERYLYENGIITVKFFLNVSRDEQKKRFLQRLDDPTKNWKFSSSDLKERGFWNEYQKAYEECLNGTSTKYGPWYVVPADKKWYARLLISEVITQTLESFEMDYPKLNEEQMRALEGYRQQLMAEKE
ncbi:MAG: Polyphosphate:ADP phosphotransferase [Ignavibacteriaceae bacterium]|nr:Polyphosphate:ADP phosphotransferase [Ignavibacteriaceae bacterium]